MTTIMQPFHCDLQQRIPSHPITIHAHANASKTAWSHRYTKAKKKRQNDPSRTRRTHEVPFIAGCSHFHGKHMVSCSGFLHKTSPMQNARNHYNVSCSITWQTCTYLRTWQHQMTTIMQPFHCDLQPQIQEMNRAKYTWATTRCRTPRENRFADETSAGAPAAHVLLCDVKSHTALHECKVMWCKVSHRPSWM